MKSLALGAALLLAFIFSTACDKKGGGGPTGPTPTVTNVTLAPSTDFITIKAVQTFSATANFSDGSSRVVQATWGSDAPAVAAVDAGRVTGVSPGLATIFADYEGQRGVRPLRVVPDYQGRWTGDWSITSCTDGGDLSGICSEYAVGDLFAITLVASQARDGVSGTIDFGDELPGAIAGSIRPDGHLTLNGTYAVTIEDLLFELTIANWDTISLDNQRMTGHLTLSARVAGLQGSYEVAGDLRVVTKTSTTPAHASSIGASLLRRGLGRLEQRR
jgi:hypothetical protein